MRVGVVSPGAMGSAVARSLAAGGAEVVSTVAGRSARTRRLAAGLPLVPDLDALVAGVDVVVSIVPPGDALAAAREVARAAARTGTRPLVADLNALAPATVGEVGAVLRAAGLDLVDGSISGGPPRPGSATRLYLAGPRAGELGDLRGPGLDVRVLRGAVGTASALKMCTASVYKGSVGLLANALLTARAHGVVEEVLDDLRASGLGLADAPASTLGRAAAKAVRYVPEMREIAATQAAAGLSPELFEAFAGLYARLAGPPAASVAPEDVDPGADLDTLLAALAREVQPEPPRQ